MNCDNNCPCMNGGNQNTPKRTVIRHVQGNNIELFIPLTRMVATVSNGTTTKDATEYPIYDVKVVLQRGKHIYEFPALVNGINTAYIEDTGTLPVGTYSITVTFRGTDGVKYRYKKNAVLQIVDTIEEGCEYSSDEYNVIAYYPTIEGHASAILISDHEVIITEAGKFQGDNTPNDSYADVAAEYGEGYVEVGDNDVTLHI